MDNNTVATPDGDDTCSKLNSENASTYITNRRANGLTKD